MPGFDFLRAMRSKAGAKSELGEETVEGGGERKGRREGLGHSPAEGVLCHAGLRGTGVNPGGGFAKKEAKTL